MPELDRYLNLLQDVQASFIPPQIQSFQKISSNSKKILAGDIFVACRGEKVDGNQYVSEAIHQGAVLIISELQRSSEIKNEVGWIQVEDAMAALSVLLREFYNYPDQNLKLIGVTGTNGKTTITTLLYHLISTKAPCALVGTMEYRLPQSVFPAPNTTPGFEDLIELLAQAQQEGAKYVVMEVSSHALVQKRVLGLQFELAVFTPLTQDHLDYHGSMENYFDAKASFFRSHPNPRKMLVHGSCEYGVRLLEEFSEADSYGLSPKFNFWTQNREATFSGSKFLFCFENRSLNVEIKLPLEYNIENTVAALAVLTKLGWDPQEFIKPLSNFDAVCGRMEEVGKREDFKIFVDYAHTPDAFFQVLSYVKKLEPRRVVTVFGCGGDRDRGKRSQMASIADQFSDLLYLTSDNPRTEDPLRIMSDMKSGLAGDFREGRVFEMLDRKEAIQEAVKKCVEGDVLLVLGKGHEDYQILGQEKIYFSDHEVIRKCLESMKV